MPAEPTASPPPGAPAANAAPPSPRSWLSWRALRRCTRRSPAIRFCRRWIASSRRRLRTATSASSSAE
eukprot:3100300-Alexandrium_andersonii.AAC.1